MGDSAAVAVALETSVTAGSVHSLFVVLGVAFGQRVNGEMYDLTAGGANALVLGRVDVVVGAGGP